MRKKMVLTFEHSLDLKLDFPSRIDIEHLKK